MSADSATLTEWLHIGSEIEDYLYVSAMDGIHCYQSDSGEEIEVLEHIEYESLELKTTNLDPINPVNNQIMFCKSNSNESTGTANA